MGSLVYDHLITFFALMSLQWLSPKLGNQMSVLASSRETLVTWLFIGVGWRERKGMRDGHQFPQYRGEITASHWMLAKLQAWPTDSDF